MHSTFCSFILSFFSPAYFVFHSTSSSLLLATILIMKYLPRGKIDFRALTRDLISSTLDICGILIASARTTHDTMMVMTKLMHQYIHFINAIATFKNSLSHLSTVSFFFQTEIVLIATFFIY